MEPNTLQIQNISFSDDMIDVKTFEKQQKIDFDSYEWKYFIIMNLITGTKNIVKSSKDPFNKFTISKINSFYHEVDISIKLNHPSIPKYIGYNLFNFKNKPNPMILYECSFQDTLENKYTKDDFNDTNKLITLFGIASGMSYLHSHNILHRKLSIYNILFDESFHPKIFNFENAIEIPENKPFKDISFKEQDIEYIAPEVFTNYEYSKASDVYSFALILYQIVYKKYPEIYSDVHSEMIPYMTKNGEKPLFDEPIIDAYRNLIERCWSQDPKLRPTFDEIVTELKTNAEFITENVNEEEYRKYIKFIEDYQSSFKDDKTKMNLDELMKFRTHIFLKNFVNLKLRGPSFTGIELDVTKYTLKDSITKKIEYNDFEINYVDKDKMNELQKKGMDIFYNEIDKYKEIYRAEVYFKEISLFYKHEIVNFARKLSILSQINHPAILNFIGYSPIDFNGNLKPVIVTENHIITLSFFCKQPYNQKNDLIWNDTRKLINIYGIAHAMKYLHENNIIHRDLKIDNIANDESYNPKLTGFNISKFLNDGETISKSNKIKGTPAYIAPEIYSKGEYSKMSDVYSFGFIIYEILTGNKPFNEFKSPKEIKDEILIKHNRPIIDEFVNETYRELIERCWSQDPYKRPTFEAIVTELKTNPKFITEEIDKEDFFDYVEYIDEFPIKFDTTKRIKKYDNLIKSKLHTFNEMDPYFSVDDMYDTETNDLLLDYDYFNTNDYLCRDKLGKGMSYKVDLRIHPKTEDLNIHKTISNHDEYLKKDEIINYSRELNIIIKLNHPSIIKFIGYSQRYKTYYLPCIIVEYAPNDSLFKLIEKIKSDPKSVHNTWNDTKKLINIYGIAHAMKYLHENNIIHRDLKTENIVLDESYNPKLTGFNISKFLNDGETISKSNKLKGTPAYIAPEIYSKGEYSKMSDVYSFGFIIYEILTGNKPFKEFKSPKEIKDEILIKHNRPIIDEFVNETYRELIERCWSQDPYKRPTFEAIVTELKTNPKFITENVKKDEYQNYLKFIEESPKSFNANKHISQFDYKIKSRKYGLSIQEKSSKINFRNIYKTELNEVLFNYSFENINDYKKQKLIHATYKYKLYEVLNIKTHKICLAIKFNEHYEDFYGAERIKFEKQFNNNLILNHPTILKYIGYSPFIFKNKPYPTIITEYGSNGTLKSILDVAKKNQSEMILNETQKLIIIYGIASAMLYLHSHNLIYCKLKPLNIFLDEFLFPKINGFLIWKEKSENPIPDISQMNFNTSKCKNDEDIYIPPEKYLYNSSSTARDVYAFSMIVYQLITNEEPFSEVNYEIIQQICEQKLRPKFKDTVPECYRKLIEKCWSNDPKERPSFNEIIYHLKTNPEFINEKVNKEQYQSYIDFIDESQTTQNTTQFDDFIKSKNITFRKVDIDLNKLRSPLRLNFSIDFGSIDLNDFEKEKKIGSGGFGVVYKVHKKETDNYYAAKISIYEMDQCDDDTIINLTREIDIISKLSHDSILQYIGFNPYNFKCKPKPIIITEYASNGSLDNILELERMGTGNYEWNDTKKLINIYGIAAGMAYLHKRNIIHRDLKPGNILLDDNLYPKIADFGLSKVLSEEDDVECKRKRPKSSGFKGTYAYCAPEIIGKHAYTKMGDVYAYGMIVYEIMTCDVLFEGFNVFQLIHKVLNGYRPQFKYPIQYCYRKLIENCWSDDSRPEFEEIVKVLETNKDFITSNVDEDEFLDYISLINQNENTIIVNTSEKDYNNLNQQEPSSNKYKEELQKSNSNLKRIEEIEKDENQENEIFLDLSKYLKQDLIFKGDSMKLYKFQEIETGKIFLGQMSMQKIHQITQKDEEELSKELKIIQQMKHPSLLQFVGFSLIDFKKEYKPVILTEYASNNSLFDILEIERNKQSIPEWNDTKKLINIYGIASSMSYLHSHDIIHRSLKPSTIYLDEILTPKIGDFGLSTRFINSESITHQSITCAKATPIYSAPEVLQLNKYSKASDIYAFAFIVFELMTNEIPFNDITNQNQIFNEVVIKQNRPLFNKTIPAAYKNLIEKCWAQNPSERPTFDEIVDHLKVNPKFIIENVNNDDYQRYIKHVDEQINNKMELQKVKEIEN